MLALVKKPSIEISLQGENVSELIEWISKKYEVNILTSHKSLHKKQLGCLAVLAGVASRMKLKND